jgi:hypothetical protein
LEGQAPNPQEKDGMAALIVDLYHAREHVAQRT